MLTPEVRRESSSSPLSLLLTRTFYVCLVLTLSDHTHMHACPHMPTHTHTHTQFWLLSVIFADPRARSRGADLLQDQESRTPLRLSP